MRSTRSQLACFVAVALATLTAGPLIAQAQRVHGPLTDIPVCSSPGWRSGPRIVPDGRQGTIIAWYDFRDESNNTDIYAQGINAGGILRWNPRGVGLCVAPGEQYNVALASDGRKGAIAAWTDRRGGGGGVFAQRVSKQGSPMWAATGVPLFSSQGFTPVISPDGFGGALVVCESGLLTNILAQRVDASGSVLWGSAGLVVSSLPSPRFAPKVVADNAGGAFLTWTDERQGVERVYGQHVSAEGRLLWGTTGIPQCTVPSDQRCGALVSDDAGGAIVVWRDSRKAPSNSIFAQRVDGAGELLWDSAGVDLAAHSFIDDVWIVAIPTNGGATVAWHDHRAGDYDIYGQRIDASGSIHWDPDGVPLCVADGDQTYPAIASDGADGAFITWGNVPPAPTGIYAQHVDPSGTLRWGPSGVIVSASVSRWNARPVIAPDGPGGAVVAWESDDLRTILAHRLTGEDTPPGVELPGDVELRGMLGRLSPNPFVESTQLHFTVHETSPVSLRVYDMAGRLVRDILNAAPLGPGEHSLRWDGRGADGVRRPPGIYFCRLEIAGREQTRRAVLLK